jgi:HlyD family secretion protein
VEAGATVNAGVAILKVADPRTAWVTVHVDEREVGAVHQGDPAVISLRTLPGREIPGRVARIQRESDRVTEQLAVDIAFDERPDRLTLGQQAEAIIRPPARPGATAIPLGALIRTAEGPGAWIVAGGRLAFRPLRLGLVDPAGWAEVVEGVQAGEEVVVGPGRLAYPQSQGRRVAVARAGSSRRVSTAMAAGAAEPGSGR